MKKEDFKFNKFDKPYEDYWFDINGETANELTEKYMEQSLIGVTQVVYSAVEDIVGIRLQFPFNFTVRILSPEEDGELKKLLYELIKEIKRRGY